MNAGSLSWRVTGPFTAVFGILVGVLGGTLYWLAAQLWPSSVAVILSMAGTALLSFDIRVGGASRGDLLACLFGLFIKYNALMALSAAKLPFAAPANVPLALIMICGHAASFGLLLFIDAARTAAPGPKTGHGALIAALLIGFAPAALLGIPGLIGLAAAVIAGIGVIAWSKYAKMARSAGSLDQGRLAVETCFYLGALASWRFV